jgi:UDP-N-acetylglucosamine 2-epimerase (non-hydrolysing)
MTHVTLIAGARPNFMKVAPVVRALQRAGVRARLVHTGQHYDDSMSGAFFRELAIPDPDVNLGVGSGSHVWQLAEIMKRLETEFSTRRPALVVVVGDVNSTLGAAMAAVKMGIPVAHVEAGLRSFDRSMPEEINRVLTDAISELLFTSEPSGTENLLREGIAAERIHFVGNVMIDTLQEHLPRARQVAAWKAYHLSAGGYALLTLHRPSNVDCRETLRRIFQAVHEIARRVPVVFPVHPRTAQRIRAFGLADDGHLNGCILTEPLSYLPMLSLLQGALLVLTDSGGIQEETTALKIPCLTLRENTERPITVQVGTNRLVGNSPEAILEAVDQVLRGDWPAGQIPDKWDGHASDRIATVITHWLERKA